MVLLGFLFKCCIVVYVLNLIELEGRKIGEVINILFIVFCFISLLSVLFFVWFRKEGNSEVF